MGKIKTEDIVFWIAIIVIIGIALWLLSGSPPEINAIISIAIFVAIITISLWKKMYSNESKTLIGFEKVGSEIKLIKNDMNHKFNEINKKLDGIKTITKRIK